MKELLKAEFRKLFFTRSTYALIFVVLAVNGFIAFFVDGIRADTGSLQSANTLFESTLGAANFTGIFVAVIGALLIAHEYRYHTIAYTLTAANSRSKVLLAKASTLLAFTFGLTVIVCVLSGVLFYIGVAQSANPYVLVQQHTPLWDLAWRCLFFTGGYAIAGVIIAEITRSTVGAIATLLLVPSTIELVLTLLLKNNAVYLPFTALSNIVDTHGKLAPGKAALVFTGYLVVAGALAWVSFTRRDASS
jgi:ABC-type transport system involved in multi-copper enzyme maturation permease subunit